MAKKSNKLEQDQENQLNKLNEGFMSRLMRKIITKKFEKVMNVAYKDPSVRAAYAEFDKATEDLLSTLKGSSVRQRHIRSKKSDKQTRTAKGRQAHIDDMMKKWGYSK
tara:strand:- start:2573 stop:2896 length:324 start_codon:yes stop_codon:yes gene_type:complete